MGDRLMMRGVVPAALLAAGLALVPLAGMAQDATPAMTGETGMGPHPAHIHAGSCPEVGDVVFPLTDITRGDAMGTPVAGMDDSDDTAADDSASDASPMAGDDDATDDMDDGETDGGMGEVVAMSTTEVPAALADILAAEHAINVHLSAEEIGVYIACGDISGEADDDGLEIRLNEENDSGYQGMATLMDNGDGTTTVDVMLMMSGAEMAQEATPTP